MRTYLHAARGCLPHLVVSMTMAFASATAAEAELDRDLEMIMSWWNGDYNNDRQIQRLLAAGEAVWRADGTGEGGHIEVTSHYRPIDLPAFGEHVIYVEETKHGDPNNIFRQRIYTLQVDEGEGAVRVKLWNFKDKTEYVGAWRDLTQLEGLTVEEMSALPDKCDLIAIKQGGKYHLPMRDRDCAFGERYFNYQVLLSPNSFWFRDKIVNLETNEVLETAGNFTYHELDKVK